MKKVIVGLLVCCFLLGCNGAIIVRRVTTYYYLVAIDAEEQLALSYAIGGDGSDINYIITQTVFAVGCDSNYLIAKQHPSKSGNPFVENKSITNYYIVHLNKEYDAFKSTVGLIGPLTKDEFYKKRKELNIEDIKFTIVYKNLE